MTKLFIIIAVIIVIIAITLLKESFEDGGNNKNKYQYKRKNFFLTRAEHECFDSIMKAVGEDYLIFAQVHLPTLIDNKVVGQNWRAAFRHINGKSVDFVLCDKAYISPKLAIELDDKTHERPDRQERDVEVERILKEAGVLLLRLENNGSFNSDELAQKVKAVLST
jgi:very-short-patch-repair endonuclease